MLHSYLKRYHREDWHSTISATLRQVDVDFCGGVFWALGFQKQKKKTFGETLKAKRMRSSNVKRYRDRRADQSGGSGQTCSQERGQWDCLRWGGRSRGLKGRENESNKIVHRSAAHNCRMAS